MGTIDFDADDHDCRGNPAFDAPMTSILYPDLQNWTSESTCDWNFLFNLLLNGRDDDFRADALTFVPPTHRSRSGAD
jgi:hypothetical protein